MGKVVASYLVKVTVREPDGLAAGLEVERPTIEELEDWIHRDLEARTEVVVHVSAERTDI